MVTPGGGDAELAKEKKSAKSGVEGKREGQKKSRGGSASGKKCRRIESLVLFFFFPLRETAFSLFRARSCGAF